MIVPAERTQVAMPNIQHDVETHLLITSKVLPHHTNWASDLADPCLRKLVYHRTCWEKQEKPAPYLQGIFETGTILEHIIINNLNWIGVRSRPHWEFVKPGFKLNDNFMKAHQIGCNPDVFLTVYPERGMPEVLGPVDVKTASGNIYRQINGPQDFDSRPHLRRYPGQIMTYELASNFEIGWLLVVNKDNLYDFKMIAFPMDYGFMDTLIEKADTVNGHVKAGTLPEQINRPEECNRCNYRSHCCPSCCTGGNFACIDNDELEECLLALDDLRDQAKEINALETYRDRILKGCQGKDLLVGEHVIQWSKSEGIHPPKPAVPYVTWRKTITRIGYTNDFTDNLG